MHRGRRVDIWFRNRIHLFSGGILSVEGGVGGCGNCVTFVTGLGDLGGGLRPLEVELDLDCELVLRVGRAMMRNCA